MDPPKAIIFDLDGTLIHSAPDLHFAANTMLRALDRPTLDLDTVISFIGNGVGKLVERSLVATGGAEGALQTQALALFMDTYNQNMTTLTRLYPGVRAALDGFIAAGLPLGICTNKPTAPAKAICEALGLTRDIAVIAGAETDQPRKPDPASLRHVITTMGHAPHEVLYVGDSGVDYHTAKNADVAFRLFTGGYLNDALPDLSVTDRFDDWSAHGIPLS